MNNCENCEYSEKKDFNASVNNMPENYGLYCKKARMRMGNLKEMSCHSNVSTVSVEDIHKETSFEHSNYNKILRELIKNYKKIITRERNVEDCKNKHEQTNINHRNFDSCFNKPINLIIIGGINDT